jgi:hypothetical protein
MSAPPMGSLLIASNDVKRLKDWYRQAFDASENEMGALEFGELKLFVEEHSEVSGPAKEPARIIMNLDVGDCRALEKHLNTHNVKWVRKPEQTTHALVGTVEDPDGNYVQVIQWGAP